MLANGRLCEILGYPRDELVGRNVRDLSHPEDRDAATELRASLHRGEDVIEADEIFFDLCKGLVKARGGASVRVRGETAAE